MLPIQAKPEPANFDLNVRQPGLNVLLIHPNPTEKEWKGKEFWQKSLPELRTAYNQICVYSSTWIPHSTGTHSVDHFIPKKLRPDLAYEWNNFRYVSTRFNSRKGLKTILDPFLMVEFLFQIDFKTLFIKPNAAIVDNAVLVSVQNTIKILKLNDDDELVKERFEYCTLYWNNEITFDYLSKKVPLIALELQRQNLIN
ncbi:hypothetical protein [Dyadobacter sp. CY356]|uniref:hypothetical protein n=1 Tax=Dyadobacter sp. CY356 TaxID=2906442 RepID=UPI001F3393CD|nr:hypothetical protein [Dyadobacter sp. CY356]MCF0056855.1 hypothetical protein [Dyadobacter sp. CY356]